MPSIKFTVHDDDQNKYNLTRQFRDNGICESYTGCGVISPTGRLFALFTFVPKKLKSYSHRVSAARASGLKVSFRAPHFSFVFLFFFLLPSSPFILSTSTYSPSSRSVCQLLSIRRARRTFIILVHKLSYYDNSAKFGANNRRTFLTLFTEIILACLPSGERREKPKSKIL